MPHKIEDHIEPGMQIGHLTVIDKDSIGRFGMQKWRVHCTCGNDLLADESALKRHHIRSCGCSDGFADLVGQKFGMMTVLARALNDPAGKSQWLCRCDCGNEKVLRSEFLKHRPVPNCGCYTMVQWRAKSTKHGLDKHPLSPVWHAMINRCHNPNSSGYYKYGAKGITVCDRWRFGDVEDGNGLQCFIKDMSHGFHPGLQIDRINNNGGYSPTNCRWVTPKENARNKSDNHIVLSVYGAHPLVETSELSGLGTDALINRERKGYPPQMLTIKSRARIDSLFKYINGEESLWLDPSTEKKLDLVIRQAQAQVRDIWLTSHHQIGT